MINFILALALSLRISMLLTYGAPADGLNAADFATLCVLGRQSSGKLSEAYPKITVPSTSIDKIREIVAETTNAKNITSVPADAIADEAAATDTAANNKKTNKGECKAYWGKWRTVKKAAKQAQDLKFKSLSESQRRNKAASGFSATLQDIKAEATATYNQLNQQADNAANLEKSPAATKLNNAKYGAGKTKVEGGPNAGHGKGSDRSNGCKNPNTGTSLVHDFFCLCVTDTTSKTKKPCGSAVTSCDSAIWESCSQDDKQAAWSTLESKCKEIYQGKTTAQRIRAGLAAFRGYYKGKRPPT
uniref:Variant surface glycoprotein 1764 n=1 Tax=Trypanosoma brucei TaxID=5691 RepID=M4SX73_9TRYP|nr:variant surface glycoprotein 1764 [Trypanosoma brucei]